MRYTEKIYFHIQELRSRAERLDIQEAYREHESIKEVLIDTVFSSLKERDERQEPVSDISR
jgi:hypothetical protein